MLGRQQIAGIPTAIHELFKNAYDAYATCAEVDYYRQDQLFLLRDDGYGMSREAFEERWLTLGTDSKLNAKGSAGLPFQDIVPKNKRRSPLGEKGIGRLAIAAIGPQVLVLSRPKLKTGTGPLTAAFINWGMFELPGVDIDKVEIPIVEFKGAELPTVDDVEKMVDSVRKNLLSVAKSTDPRLVARIEKELDLFEVDPAELDASLGAPSVHGTSHGTHFFVLPTTRIINHDIDGDGEKDKEATPLQKSLLGFANTMTPEGGAPPIRTAFRNWIDDATYTEPVGQSEFFTPDDFNRADHRISGTFDASGRFSGTVTVYGEKRQKYSLPAKDTPSEFAACGPFSFEAAVVQGKRKESKLPADEWTWVTKRMDKIGGLYVYKDGVRVLPYGDVDNDFLEIEKRRTKGASYYYFSHRRMFGAITVSSNDNPSLIEKAGREGFVKNAAYREFRRLLMNFLISIANDFFRETGEYSAGYQRVQRDLARKDKVREEQAAVRRKAQAKLRAELEVFFIRLNQLDHEASAATLKEQFTKTLDRAAQAAPDKRQWAVDKAERDFYEALTDLRNRDQIEKPKGVGLTKALRLEFASYEEELERLDKEVFKPLVKWFEKTVARALKGAAKAERTAAAKQKTADALLKKKSDEFDSVVKGLKKETDAIHPDLKNALDAIAKSGRQAIEKASAAAIKKAAGGVSRQSDIQTITAELESALRRSCEQAEALRGASKLFREMLGSGDYSSLETKEVLEEQIEDLTDEIDESLELVQMGRAIGVVHHEFLSTIKNLRQGIDRIEPWAEQHPDLLRLYRQIHTDFDHLHGYLLLFDPLSRRLNPKAVKISGKDIYDFLENLFGATLKKAGIQLDATTAFKSKSIVGYTSTFYPCFVNLIDNAVYWLTEYTNQEDRKITLDTHRQGFTVSDTGPGIEPRYRNRVFDFGFSRKTGGRGMGLYICRESLKREDHDLELLKSDAGHQTIFLIKINAADEGS